MWHILHPRYLCSACKLSANCLVCVYVNHGCECGPTLVASRIAKLPLQFGPASIRRVLRQSLQAIVDSAKDQNSVFGLLQEGNGRVVISGEISQLI